MQSLRELSEVTREVRSWRFAQFERRTFRIDGITVVAAGANRKSDNDDLEHVNLLARIWVGARPGAQLHGRKTGGSPFCSTLKKRGESMPNRRKRLGLAVLACAGIAIAISNSPAPAWDRGDVETFAALPQGTPKIEGLTVGEDGNVYV